MLNEVFHTSLIISHKNGIVILQDLAPYLPVFRKFEYLIDIDIIEDMIIFSEEDNHCDKYIDGYDKENYGGKDYYE